jgi:hypothetical protein
MRLLLLLCLPLALALAACAGGEPLATAHGSLFALNPGLWQPTPTDLAQPPAVEQP